MRLAVFALELVLRCVSVVTKWITIRVGYIPW